MPIFDPHSIEFVSNSAEQTRRLGMRLGNLLGDGDVVCLCGNLGTGKTTFVQGLAAGWGSFSAVTSPTFVLVNEYERLSGGTLFHFDAYRVESSEQAFDIDFDLMLESGMLVIEWPERIRSTLPEEHLWVDLSHVSEGKRRLVFRPAGERYQRLINIFRKRSFGGM